MAASRLLVGEHLTRFGFLRDRHGFGTRRAFKGDGPSPRHAVKAMVQTLAGAGVDAACSREDRPLMDSASNLAVALGALTPRMARSQFSPAAAPLPTNHQPLTGQVPRMGGRRRLRRTARPTVILLYHRLGSGVDERGLSVSVQNFEQHLAVLSELRSPLTLCELVAGLRRGSVPAGGVCITFDDGYTDNLMQALPRLNAVGFPTVMFVTTGPIARQERFYWDEVDDLLMLDPPGRPSLTVGHGPDARTWLTSTDSQGLTARGHLHSWMQPQALEVIDETMQQLRAWHRQAPRHGSWVSPWRPMTISEVVRFRSAGGEIGGHSRWHTNLGFQAPDRQGDEVLGCRRGLTAWMGVPPEGFSYPYGNPSTDFTGETQEIVRRSGYSYAVANAPGPVTANSDPYALPRLAVPDLDGDRFAAWLGSLSS